MLKVWDVGNHLLVEISTSLMFLFDLFLTTVTSSAMVICSMPGRSKEPSLELPEIFLGIQPCNNSWNAWNIIPGHVMPCLFSWKHENYCHMRYTNIVEYQSPHAKFLFFSFWGYLVQSRPQKAKKCAKFILIHLIRNLQNRTMIQKKENLS